MTIEFHLSDIGEGLNEAEVVSWLVNEGDTVTRNQPVVEILTDKSSVEMPAPASGVVTRLGAAVGDMVRVGELLVVIDDGEDTVQRIGGGHGGPQDEPAPAAATTPTSATTPSNSSAAGQSTPDAAPTFTSADEPASPARRPKASPVTRKLAAEHGVDLATIAGTGPGGRILADDVYRSVHRLQHDSRKAATPAPGRPVSAAPAAPSSLGSTSPLGQAEPGVIALRGIRRATAKAMDLSWSTIPHVTAMNEIDATELLVARAQLRESAPPGEAKITPLALMVLAVARALQRFPLVNATLDLDADTITVHDDVNISIAVATDAGLMVPVIQRADQLGLRGLAHEIARLSIGARAGELGPEDHAGSTFTVSNYGTQGGYLATPIIRPGESGIVGFGQIAKRPMVVGDDVKARPVLPVVVSGDHRLIDGDLLNAFLNDIMASLSQPITLLL